MKPIRKNLIQESTDKIVLQHHISIQSPEKDFLTLKSIEGKVIGTYSIDKGTTEISTTYLSNGVYTLTFVNQNQTFKLIKQ